MATLPLTLLLGTKEGFDIWIRMPAQYINSIISPNDTAI
jgi:hypothetical protein